MTRVDLPGPTDAAADRSLPAAIRGYRRLLDVATAAAKAAVVFLMVALFLIVSTQFVDRYLFPLWGGVPADEYVKVGIIWLTFLGFGVAMRAGVEIRVDIVDAAVRDSLRRWLYGALDLLVCVVLAVVLWKGVRLYQISAGQLILGTDMTVAVPTLGMLLGLALAALSIVERMVLRFHRAGGA